MSENIGHGNRCTRFCVIWSGCRTMNPGANQELLAALGDPDPDLRVVAEVLLQADLPRPKPMSKSAEAC